jgi:hypothetical protein
MKIDLPIHSSDSNPMYLDFWPLVSKVWHVRFGLRPLLVYIDENHDIPIDTTYGDVIKMKPVPGVPVYLQCLWVRYWIPSQFPDKICMISDIDMFPVSTNYFVDMLKDISEDKYAHLNASVDYLPSCYHVAKGVLFKKVLSLHDSWEDSIRMINSHTVRPNEYNATIEFLKDKLLWGIDEEYATKCVRAYPDQTLFVLFHRRHGRIDRGNWTWSEKNIDDDVYADSHSIRPYRNPENRHRIDNLVAYLTRPRSI